MTQSRGNALCAGPWFGAAGAPAGSPASPRQRQPSSRRPVHRGCGAVAPSSPGRCRGPAQLHVQQGSVAHNTETRCRGWTLDALAWPDSPVCEAQAFGRGLRRVSRGVTSARVLARSAPSRCTRSVSYVQMRAHSSPFRRALRSMTIVLRLHDTSWSCSAADACAGCLRAARAAATKL